MVEGYSPERRHGYYLNRLSKVSVYELNRSQQLAKAKRKGYVTSYVMNKYQFNSEELPFLSHAVWDDTGRCCDHLDRASLEALETAHLVE